MLESSSETPATIDPRNQPAYSLAEAARFLKVPPATLRTWTLGRGYPTSAGRGQFDPLIHPASTIPTLLSFWNLIEAHVLRALRSEHGVGLKAVRQAVRYAEKELQIDRLLLAAQRDALAKGAADTMARYKHPLRTRHVRLRQLRQLDDEWLGHTSYCGQ